MKHRTANEAGMTAEPDQTRTTTGPDQAGMTAEPDQTRTTTGPNEAGMTARPEDRLVRRRLRGTEGIEHVRGRFGGLDTGATLAGAFAALGITVLLGGIFAGAGRVVYVNGLRGSQTATAGSLIAGAAVIVVAFLVGGWVAGRMSRYDGGRNGMVTALWFIIFAAATSALGALLGESYNVFAGQHLPQWFTDNARTPGAIGSAAIAIVLMIAAGYLGGLVGDRYHRRIDRLVAGVTPVEVPADEVRAGDAVVDPEGRGRRLHGSHRRGRVVSGPAAPEIERSGETSRA